MKRTISFWRVLNHDVPSFIFALIPDRGRVEFEYEWEGRTYADGHAIMKTRRRSGSGREVRFSSRSIPSSRRAPSPSN